MSFGSKNKATADEKKAKIAADLEAKKAAKAEKAAEAKAKKEAAIAERNAAKNNNKKDKVGSKLEQDKSQLAKDLNIRISSPYGYYPDDVDPIIIDLQNQISNLSKENKQLTDNNDKLKKDNEALRTEITRMKFSAQLFERPISMEESLIGLSKINDITGNHSNESPLDAIGLLQDDDPIINLDDDPPPVEKPKLKLNLKNNKKGSS